MIKVTLARPWLLAEFERPLRCLSHAPYGAGYRMAKRVLWREVRNAELSVDFDAENWLAAQLQAGQAHDGLALSAEVAMLTSRDLSAWHLATAEVEGVQASALVTLGLSNAEAVGARLPYHSADEHSRAGGGAKAWGTINILVAASQPLSEAAQLEALTIAVEARTAAVMDLALNLSTGRATGTGTDCTVMAAPPALRGGEGGYAGLHTPIGEAIGRATRQAVTAAGEEWREWRQSQP